MQTRPCGPPSYLSGILETLALHPLWILLLVALVLSIVFYRKVLQVIGVAIVPEDRIGLVTKKFVIMGEHKELPSGPIIAPNGEAGFQSQTLAPGLYFWKYIWQYEITLQPLTVIQDGLIGLIMSKDGGELLAGAVLARRVDCQMFQDAEMFLRSGG